jgi:hypothetical protein
VTDEVSDELLDGDVELLLLEHPAAAVATTAASARSVSRAGDERNIIMRFHPAARAATTVAAGRRPHPAATS